MPDLNTKNTPSGEHWRGQFASCFKRLTKRVVAAALIVCMTVPTVSVSTTQAAGETRSLKLYFVHTKEKAVITFKRNGRFDPKGLAQINQFLRDWRRNEPTKMDPRLFDLVWEVYQRSGASDYIHVVSAYRSPTTNGALRSRTKGVAKNSQHMLGKAMDFYIPGVKLATLRQLAMKMQVGGVGFYPKSGSPFVHLDVGGVRAWPRMSRQELVQLFPNGNTIHLPADGKPLPGYVQAMADYKSRVSSSGIEIASTAGPGATRSSSKKRPNLLTALFGGGGDEDEDADAIAAPEPEERPQLAAPRAVPAPQPAPEPVMVAAVAPTPAPTAAMQEIVAPVPLARPAFRQDGGPGGLATALYSPARNAAQEALALQASAPATAAGNNEAFTDLASYKIPVPTLLGPRGLKGDADTSAMTASLGAMTMPTEELRSVPLPASRPSGAEKLLASVEADPESEADLQEQQALTPAVIAALAQSGAYVRSTMSSAKTPAAAAKPVDVASISPKVIKPAPKAMQFDDGFDTPKPAVTASAAGMPAKGGRPTPKSGISGGALTGDALAKWALNNNRADAVASVKAPRVTTRTLNADYSAAYASNGFWPVAATAKAIDPNRFGR